MPDGVDLVTAAGLVEVAATVVSNFDVAEVGCRRRGAWSTAAPAASGRWRCSTRRRSAPSWRPPPARPDKLDYCRSIGADLAISYRDDWIAAVRELSDGRGVDVILDVMGAKYLEQHVGLLATGGRLVVIGLQGGTKGTLDLGRLLRIRGRVIATTLRSRPVAEKAAICRRVEEAIWPLVGDGSIAPAPQTRFPSPMSSRPIGSSSRATTWARSC